MPSATEPEPLWDAAEVAAYLKVPKATLYRWRTKKVGPPARRVGRYLRYNPSEVADWFNNLQSHLTDDDPP
ncbi:helix-turn-helix domain-containing protein [Kribbella sp. CA-294648]|uniref:helix-turn-helix domain-containing protein n=1 Tax=Kribbella sp. CA-294648 TaxID=3239948 RepID=UPI003D927A26